MNTPAERYIQEATFDLFHSDAHLVQSQGADGTVAMSCKMCAMAALRDARKQVDKALRALEREVYEPRPEVIAAALKAEAEEAEG